MWIGFALSGIAREEAETEEAEEVFKVYCYDNKMVKPKCQPNNMVNAMQ